MSKSPKNKNNQNKNLFFFIRDLSNNNPFLDPSNSIIKNPLFSPLQPWKRNKNLLLLNDKDNSCLLYTSPSPRDRQKSRMPSSA